MRVFFVHFLLLLFATIQATAAPPISQREACESLSKSVIRLEAGGKSLGTGFLVSADGFIFTAGHVIADKTTGNYFSVIEAVMPDGTLKLAKVFVPMTGDSSGQDYAILKVEGKSDLPFLALGTVSDAIIGSDATIIGYPFSAITLQDQNVSTKFCVSATIAASDLVTVPVDGTQRINQREVPFKANVKVDVIYFQGPSVKGISGSPIISRDTGKVIGIVTLKLTGIGATLSQMKQRADAGRGSIAVSGIGDVNSAFAGIIKVLDDQLANGYGAATGIDDPAHALNMAKKKK